MNVPSDVARGVRRYWSADFGISVILLLFFCGAFLIAGAMPPGAALFPRFASGTGFILCAAKLGMAVWPSTAVLDKGSSADDRHHERVEDEISKVEVEDDAEYVFAHAAGTVWAASLAWVALFFSLLYLGGLYVAVPVFSALYLRYAGRVSLWASVLYAVLAWGVLYGVLDRLLSLPMPPGAFS